MHLLMINDHKSHKSVPVFYVFRFRCIQEVSKVYMNQETSDVYMKRDFHALYIKAKLFVNREFVLQQQQQQQYRLSLHDFYINRARSAHLRRILSALEHPRGVTCGRPETSYTRQHARRLLPG